MITLTLTLRDIFYGVKCPNKIYWFLCILAVGTPMKRLAEMSQRGHDKNEKKIKGRGVKDVEKTI